MLVPRYRAIAVALTLVAAVATRPAAQAPNVTSPKQFFGFNIGDDYQLATYTQLADYWQKLDKDSDRLRVVEIGKTAEGRPQLMSIVTAPENFKKLDRYKEIARRLALADGVSEDQAHALAREGKSIVWIDGGLHATEVLGAHQLIETVYQLVSRNDPETLRILNDCIILAVHANPDGMELVSSWYMRTPVAQQRGQGPGIPRLYEKYAGHDNNRDFYMSNLPESTNMNRVLYTEWFPQIIYNHHQTGPAGTVMFAPPFRDPFNYNFDPIVPAEIDLVGAAMATRFDAEGKPGVTSRKGSSYSTWWNGGLRTTVYFHNMIGLLTETIGNPTPVIIPFVPSKQLPDASLHYPIEPQVWHFRQSIDYSITANWGVLDIASRNRENFLFNIWRMGMNSIERGSRDSWTPTPRRVIAAQAALAAESGRREGANADESTNHVVAANGTAEQFKALLRAPELRDPRGFLVPSDQPDFATATKFIDALLKVGVIVHRATAPFAAGGKNYPAGSYVVKAAQAFRPHVLDMFEPQDHPDDIPYPGSPPTRPYDNAGWTLAYQMGVKFDRVLEGFDGPFEKVEGLLKPPAGKVTGSPDAGYVFTHAMNDSFTAINRLLAAGEDVSWMTTGPSQGSFFLVAKPSTSALVTKITADLGVGFEGVATRPAGEAITLHQMRVALADQYGGSMTSGWTRFVFEQFEFPFEVVYPKAVNGGNLASKYDVLVFPSGVAPAVPADEGAGRGRPASRADAILPGGRDADEAEVPSEFRSMVGAYTASDTGPALKKFVEDGGTIIAVGRSAANLSQLFGLPIGNQLTERGADGRLHQVPSEKFYVPGSVLSAAVDTSIPVAQGVTNPVDVFYDNSPVFRLEPEAAMKGIKPVAWFASATPLRSGWAFGQSYLQNGIIGVEAPVGRGQLFLFTPEITFRGQPHGTFKFLFNGIYLAGQSGTAGWRLTAGVGG
jgi:hypothetical protein